MTTDLAIDTLFSFLLGIPTWFTYAWVKGWKKKRGFSVMADAIALGGVLREGGQSEIVFALEV
jgi:hypothetical protein